MVLVSSSSYHALRTSGFLKLPSETTPRDYTPFYKGKPGFQVEVVMLIRDAKLLDLPDWKKHVVLLLVEKKMKERFVMTNMGLK